MVDSVQQECKQCPLLGGNISEVKALDPNKVYVIDVTFEREPPLDYVSNCMHQISNMFAKNDIATILTCSQFGPKLNFIEEKEQDA